MLCNLHNLICVCMKVQIHNSNPNWLLISLWALLHWYSHLSKEDDYALCSKYYSIDGARRYCLLKWLAISCQVHVVILIPPSAYLKYFGKIVIWAEERKCELSSPITNVKSQSPLLAIKVSLAVFIFILLGYSSVLHFVGCFGNNQKTQHIYQYLTPTMLYGVYFP